MTPPMPQAVAQVFARFPDAVGGRLKAVRSLIYGLAEETETGPLTETLKWGEPAYLTERTRAGTTLRLGLVGGAPAVLVNCRTSLIEGFRRDFPKTFGYAGTRALLLPEDPDETALSVCLTRALTYHRNRKGSRA
ncbi:hypothetical protein JYP51_06515 [Ponticoccus gilvus]|nr:hypothetical protein [Enemella evansiae]